MPSYAISIPCTLLLLLSLLGAPEAFAPLPTSNPRRPQPSSPTNHNRKHHTPFTHLPAKKKGRGGAGQGFGKTPPPPTENAPLDTPSPTAPTTPDSASQTPGLSSIEPPPLPSLSLDPDAPVEERTEAILKERFGLRSFEERQGDARSAERKAETRTRMKKIREMSDEEFDLFEVLPAPLTKGIDLFLKGGLGVTTVLFILGGVGITIEAWAVSTKNTLPPAVDGFIVDVIEPNFTVGLGVLLGFSISLGIFATAQLGSKGSQYKEL